MDPTPDLSTVTGSSEEILNPEYHIPTDLDIILPTAVDKLVDPTKVTHQFLPKQGEIECLIKSINRKVLRDINLPGSLEDLKAAYLTSPHYRDIYLYLLQNKVSLNRIAMKRLHSNALNYMLLDGLLFRIVELEGQEPLTVLCIPTSKVHILLDCYHSSIMGGHSGITKCFKTISQRFYCPNLAKPLRTYITGCHTCRLFRKGKGFDRPHQKRINLNVPTMTKISIDIKEMPSNHGYSHILVLLCEVSNILVALPLHFIRAQHVVEVFQRGYLAYFSLPSHIICDLGPAFTSSLMEALLQNLNIKMITVSVTNHKSLLAEYGIKNLFICWLKICLGFGCGTVFSLCHAVLQFL